jgi:predicted transcriptional regulator
MLIFCCHVRVLQYFILIEEFPMTFQKPTDGELTILRILWDRGPSTVKEIHRVMAEGRDLPYTTVLSAFQSMLEKGLVKRDTSNRQHVYEPALQESDARRSLVDDLLEKAFHGSALELVAHALESQHTSLDDLETLRRLIAEKRRGQK